MQESVTYDFEVPVPRAMLANMQTVASQMLGSANYVVTGDTHSECLEWMKENRYAEVLNRSGVSANWSLTEFGRSQVATLSSVSKPVKFLALREGIPLADRHTFEMLAQLTSDGWQVRVAATRAPPAYQTGSDKIYWIAEATKRFQHACFHALLESSVHDQSVLAFKTNANYTDLIAGRPSYPRRPTAKEFSFDCDEQPVDKKPPRPRQPRARPAARPSRIPAKQPVPVEVTDEEKSNSDSSTSSDSGKSDSTSSTRRSLRRPQAMRHLHLHLYPLPLPPPLHRQRLASAFLMV